ncbi:MAG: hypothetical protein Kow0092_02110 [Deferrisomatales bacterium]
MHRPDEPDTPEAPSAETRGDRAPSGGTGRSGQAADREPAPAGEGSPSVPDPVGECADAPPAVPPEEIQAVAEEEAVIEEAASRPAAGTRARRDETDRLFLFAILALAVVLFLGWIGGTAIWQLRRDLAAVEGSMAGLESRAQRFELRQSRAGLLRVRADLEVLQATLPERWSREVARADQILAEVADALAEER